MSRAKRSRSYVVGFFAVTWCASSVMASDWPRFRGPSGSGVSADSAEAPARWGEDFNLKWKTALPGRGSSSPIVISDHIYLTYWSGYGTERGNPGDQADLRRNLTCIHCDTGEIQWTTPVEPYLPEDPYGGMFAQHGYASHSPVSDGERVYVFFGKTGAFAFDMDGNQLWQTSVGTESDPRDWGSASSPILYKDLLIVTASAEGEALVGLNKHTGKEVWRQEASGLNSTWGTPILVDVDDDRTDLVIGVPFEIWGLNPETGKMRWLCEAMDPETFCSSVLHGDGLVFGIEGRNGGSIAIRTGGKGDITETHVAWSGRDANRIGTPVFYDGRIYFFSRGVANCIDAETGEEIFQSRLDRASSGGGGGREQGRAAGGGGRGQGRGRGGFGGDYSSPVVADGKLYYISRAGEAFVLKAGTTFEQLATNS